MDFATTEAVAQFIKLVSTVCPCAATDRVPRGRPQATLTTASSFRPRPTPTKAQKTAPTQPKKAAGTKAHQTGPSSIISAGSDDSHTLPGSSDTGILPEVSFPVYNYSAPPTAFDQTVASSLILPLTPSQNGVAPQPAITRPLPPSSHTFLPSTPIPSSSQMLPPTAPITPSQPATQLAQPPNTQPDAFLESLMQSPTLYDLSKSQLEAVVAQVIREEGFIKLVCVDIHRQRVSRSLTSACV